ncbi:hypothetical protein HN51_036183, partial [Arachis hypogaea]
CRCLPHQPAPTPSLRPSQANLSAVAASLSSHPHRHHSLPRQTLSPAPNLFSFFYTQIDLKSIRNFAKIIGTVCYVNGALTMALVKGHKLLNIDYFSHHNTAKHILTVVDDTWLLGCLLLLASSVFWSSWIT